MTLMQFLSILRARRGLVGTLVLTTMLIALLWVWLRPARFTAQAPVVVDVRATDVGGGYSPALVASYLATQFDIARSERVARRALELAEPARAGDAARLAQLQQGLEVKPAREGNVMRIGWTGPNAQEAARIADAFSQAFVDVSLSLKTTPARQDARWFDEQVQASRQQLEQAQLRLAQFQQRSGIVGSEQVDHELARLQGLATQLAQVQAQTTDSQSKRGIRGESVPEVIQSPLVNGLKADLARAQARLEEAGAFMGPRHPQMQRLAAERDALRSRLAAETGRIAGSIESSFQAGRVRERELSAALDAQRARVLAINQDRARLNLLQQDVDAARRAFEAVSTDASKARLQSVATQTQLTPLMAAPVPARPDGPTTWQALAIGGAGGLVLAVACAVLLELARRQVRCADDIALATQVPVLAVIPSPARSFAALPGGRARLGFSGAGAA